jgi:hypothetical protein
MTDLVSGWEAGKIATLAPDDASAKAARKLALPAKWALLGADGATAWGCLQGSGSQPYQVMFALGSVEAGPFTFRCTCPSRKQPCKHVLGLLLVVAEQPGAILRQAEPPPFVAEWLAKRAEKAAQPAQPRKTPGPNQQDKSAAARMKKIAAGLDELELWLVDLLRHGLADSRLRSSAFWEARAARLVDAQAPGVAGWLRTLTAGGLQRADHTAWAGDALASLGLIYLAVQGFRHYDRLPPLLQADLRTALGWPARQEELAGEQPVSGHWLVLGRREEPVDQRLRQQRIWLFGQENGRMALILEFAFGNAAFETSLQPGDVLEAGLVFYPGAAPLRAFIRERAPIGRVSNATAGLQTRPTDVQSALRGYATALAANPWLLQFPFLLGPVWPQPAGDGWLARDEAGDALPLAARFLHGWSLLALSGGQPLTLFGEWDGAALLPLAAVVDGRQVDLARLGVR